MKKFKIGFLLFLPVALATLAGCEKTADTDPVEHIHSYSSMWSTNETQHWHQATCGHDVQEGLGNHIDSNNDEKCDVCGFSMPLPVHNHTYSSQWSTNETQHWHQATCGHDVQEGLGNHIDSNNDGKCDVCCYFMPLSHIHTFSPLWTINETQHWHQATCGHDVIDGLGNHVDSNLDGRCDVCGFQMSTPVDIYTVSEDEWNASFGKDKIYFLADNYKIECIESSNDFSSKVSFIADGNKFMQKNVEGYSDESLGSVMYANYENGSYYVYSMNQGAWSKNPYFNFKSSIEFLFENFYDMSKFTYDSTTHFYNGKDILVDNITYKNLKIKFENKKIVETHMEGEWMSGGSLVSVSLDSTFTYGNQVVILPEITHIHTFTNFWSFDEYSHWHNSTCGHNLTADNGPHVDLNDDGRCDICAYQMVVVPQIISVDIVAPKNTISIGETVVFMADVVSAGGAPTYVHWSLNNSNAQIGSGPEQNTVSITGVKAGLVILTATSDYDSTISKSIVLNVVKDKWTDEEVKIFESVLPKILDEIKQFENSTNTSCI